MQAISSRSARCLDARKAFKATSTVPAPASRVVTKTNCVSAAAGSLASSTTSASACGTSICGWRLQQVVCHASARPAVFLFGFGGGQPAYDDYDEAYTVMKLQVGIFGDITKWQKDLERLSDLHDTDEEGGLHAIFIEVLTQLNRNSEYCGYVTSGGRVFDNLDDAESKFNSVSFEERAKFKEETLTNVDGRNLKRKSSTALDPGAKDLDQWLCVTMIMAIEGEVKLPKVNNVWDFKQIIKLLAGVPVEALVAFELLWTPEDNGDSYSKDELLADYPTMVTLS